MPVIALPKIKATDFVSALTYTPIQTARVDDNLLWMSYTKNL